VEDAAQAQGASYFGKPVGGFGEMACFSFYPGKNLGACGEAGGITTNNPAYCKHLQSLRNHGSLIRYYHDEIGYNMRMGGLEGASLKIKLKYLPEWNQRRKEIAGMYHAEIKNPKLTMQWQPEGHDSVFHLFVITTENREELTKYLNAKNIFPGLHYPVPCHLQKAYSGLGYKNGDLPHSEYLASHCLSLPMYAELSNEEVDYVINTLNSY
jgi:dTDP-4-amino-4,6-dideoxygalactose transaminase